MSILPGWIIHPGSSFPYATLLQITSLLQLLKRSVVLLFGAAGEQLLADPVSCDTDQPPNTSPNSEPVAVNETAFIEDPRLGNRFDRCSSRGPKGVADGVGQRVTNGVHDTHGTYLLHILTGVRPKI